LLPQPQKRGSQILATFTWQARWCSLTARLRGTEHYARCPRRDPSTQHRQRGGRAHLVHEDEPLWVHLLRDHITLQATLRDSSRSTAPTRSGFLTKLRRFNSRLRVEVLKGLPVALRKKRHLSRIVAVGRSSTSSSGSFLIVSFALGGLPPPFSGASEAPSW
jgi:hypothetical protein